MKILFVHQNYPGQFVHLAPALIARGHDCRALTDAGNPRTAGLPTWRYKYAAPPVDPQATRLGRSYTTMADRGAVVARGALQLRQKEGYVPDLIIGHSGWGETLFLKEVWPEAKLMVYAEFYYRGQGLDIGFDPEFGLQASFDQSLIAQGRAAHMAQALAHADRGLTPTRWQASTYPKALQPLLEVQFDGTDTEVMCPDPAAQVSLPNGTELRAGDEVLTFINRNLEPYRGYHVFMRALPAVLAARPQAQVVIVGGSEASYGPPPPTGSWKDRFLDEVKDRIDLNRVHFTGKVPYPTFRSLMQVSRVHAYLTYPFVLSWSVLEAMAAGTLLVASRTPPVEEVIRHQETGILVDFHDVQGWSRALIAGLAEPERFAPLRQQARQLVVNQYDLKTICLPRLISLVEAMVPQTATQTAAPEATSAATTEGQAAAARIA